jgi:hypothetical protein
MLICVRQNWPSPEIRELEIVHSCLVVHLNGKRLEEQYFDGRRPISQHVYDEKFASFLRGDAKQLACALNQLAYQLAVNHPDRYQPVCWEVLATTRNIRVKWPPSNATDLRVETLSLFGDYQRFLDILITYLSTS